VRSITSRSLDASSNPNYAVIDTSDVTVTQDVADEMQSTAATAYKGFRLVPDEPGGRGPKIPKVATPTTIKALFYSVLKKREGIGDVIDVDEKLSELQVIIDPTANGKRALAEIPIVPAPSLHSIAANLRQVSA